MNDKSVFPSFSYADHTVLPFTLNRLAAVMDASALTYALDEGESIQLIWDGIPIRFTLSEDGYWWRTVSRWTPPEWVQVLTVPDQLQLLIQTTNEWNRNYLDPPSYPVESDVGWAVELYQSVFVGAGITHQQIALHFSRTISNQAQAHETLPTLLPPG